jgi:ribosomal protein S18 acetylase RimI-like enzyme
MRLEDSLFGAQGEKTLGPFYIRLCCNFFADTSFVAIVDGEPVGYALAFVREREGHCATLAIVPKYQRTRVVHELVRELMRSLAHRVDALWFTVHESNLDARALHATLGAREVEHHESYYGEGEPRILSRLDRAAFDKLRSRMTRLGLLEPTEPRSEVRVSKLA